MRKRPFLSPFYPNFCLPRVVLLIVLFETLWRCRSLSSNEESFFEKSLSLHICGLQFLLSFLLPERSELKIS